MSTRVRAYVERQAGPLLEEPTIEQTLNGFGREDVIWSVKTDHGGFWVIDSPELPLNLYPQEPRPLTADEAYSMHLGISLRLAAKVTSPDL